MPVYTVNYTYGPDEAPTRSALLPQHREWLDRLEEQDRLLGAGVFADTDGALLIIAADSRETLDCDLAEDPFTPAGAILATTIDEWSPVRGVLATENKKEA